MKEKKAEETFREVLLISGFASLVIGLWLIYPPAALIVGGCLLMWVGIPKRRGD